MGVDQVFGAKLRGAREAFGWTQEQLAGRLDLSSEAISKLENGHSLPSFETLVAVGKLFGLPFAILLGIEGGAPERSSKITELVQLAGQLDDRTLDVALAQLRSLRKL